MSLFFDYKANLSDEQAVLSAWSNSEYQPLLAVSTRLGKIYLFSEEGESQSKIQLARPSISSQLFWHPYLPILFSCWDDGVISYWSENENSSKEEKSVHGCRISGVAMSPDGTRMVTGDDHGIIGVWNTSRGLAPICQYNKEGSMTNLAYCSLATEPGENNVGDQMNKFFFFAGSSGSVYLADDQRRCSEVCKVGGHVKSLLFYKEDNSIVIITSSLLMVQFRVSPNEKLVPSRKVKLTVAGNPDKISTIWGGPGLLATVSGENMIRLWNLERDCNYFLTLADTDPSGKMLTDKINCIAYNEKKRIIAGGTQEGKVVMWKCKQLLSGESPSTREGWEAQLPVSLSSNPISQVSWSSSEALLSASSQSSLSILSETILRKKVRDGLVALQISNNLVEVRKTNKIDLPSQYQASIRIKGMDVSSNLLVVWNGKAIESFNLSTDTLAGKFVKNSYKCGAHKESIIVLVKGAIEVCNVQGTVKQTILMPESEGEVTSIDIQGDSMVVTTDTLIKIFDLSRREYKLKGMARKFEDKQGQSHGIIRGSCINITGTKIALLVDQAPKPNIVFPDSSIFIYDADIDNFIYYDFGNSQIPTDIAWDTFDQRLLLVEIECFTVVNEEDNKVEEQVNQAVTLFVNSENGIIKQDSIKIQGDLLSIIGLHAPYLFFTGKDVGKDNVSGVGKIIKKTMRDFMGLENSEESVIKAILNFSFFVSCGNMDEAFKAVKTIQNASVWENMCTMSVKTRRLDVAEECLRNMRFARGAKAVREAKFEPDEESKLAMVAIQLNMLEDAKELYAKVNRYDQLNKMLQACGQWEEALKIAESKDRINLRTSYYTLARHYESIQDFQAALEYYERSETYRVEVPRMYYSNNRIPELERYIIQKKDPELFKWWAQLLESKADSDGAIRFYTEAKDFGSVVRVYINLNQADIAAEVCKEKDTKLGWYLLAQFSERQGEIRDAIVYYNKSGRFHHAVKLAKDNKLDGELMSLVLRCDNTKLMLQSAKYFEQKHYPDKALILYHKGKNLKKALELCFASHNYDYLKTLVDDLGEEEDPETLMKAAEYFIAENMHDKAVQLLVSAKQYSKALEMALLHNVKLDENVMEKIIPEDNSNDPKKKEMLKSLAKLCKRQGSFQVACKIFTKLGEKNKAFKCLIRLGDVEKIKQYANTAKNAQIFILAANFMQNVDWHNNADIMKSIIFFYTKAKAWESLASFFDTCATVEIDEYRDYEKALVAEKEALKYSSKISPANENLNQRLQKRLNYLDQFVNARKIASTSPQEMVKICEKLLEAPSIDNFIRSGDVYAQMIEFYYAQENYQQAYQLLSKMRGKGIILNPYLDQELIDTIYSKVGVQIKNTDEEMDEPID
jgi:intraflagellar transport protein 140